MKRQDLLTKEEFIPSRINQKFANPQNRIKYYNDKANEFRHSVAYINKPINNNIKIILELMKGKNEEVLHKQFLTGKGFSFGFYSHIEKYENKNQFALHNYVLIFINNDQVKIIKYK